MTLEANALPSELITAPQRLIGFYGLDITQNALHKNIWEAFSSNRKPERPAVQYKLIPNNYEFPVAKPKRASYEWYHPKGILKRNWMLKHLHVLPSVIVFFYEAEWNDPQWAEKQLHCSTIVQTVKSALQERNTKLCLILMQKTSPMPPGEDALASERGSSLSIACGLNSKLLYILHVSEPIMGYVLRLESAFVDLSQTYYSLMSKRIRAHRDQLTVNHTLLKIRHQFKLGFVAEIRQEMDSALKNYNQSYATLDEIRITDANSLEIKTIAGFLNYKICRLMFKLKVPREAINTFISHIDKYKNRTGLKDILFEHYAWLTAQHTAFADLFCEAVKNGLPALPTQHPGMYFNKAAEYTMKRREAYQQSNALLPSPTESSSPLALANGALALYSEYFGVRTGKAGESLTDQQIYAILREQERNFNHSSNIISLLSLAMGQFKIYKGLRYRKKLAIDMAEEYFKNGNHEKALTLYSLMLPDYRNDKWSIIFADVLLKTLRCALLSASVSDYVSCSIEALALKNQCELSERIMVLENLWKVFSGDPPVSQSQITPELRELWESTLPSVKTPILIDLDKVVDIIEMSTSFEKVQLKNDETINALLIVKTLIDVPLKIQKFSIHLSDGTRSFKLHATKYIGFESITEMRTTNLSSCCDFIPLESDLTLMPDSFYEILFNTEAKAFLENTQLQITHIEALMGSDTMAALLFKNANYTRNPFRHHSRCKDLDDNMTINPMCYIVPTFHLDMQTNFEHKTMLVNEYFPVSTTITNQYDVFLQNVGISISVPNELRNKVFLITDISMNRQKLHSQIQIDIGELSMHSSNTASFYIFSLAPTKITLEQKLFYSLEVEKPKPLTSTSNLTITNPGAFSSNSAETSPENTPTRPSMNLKLLSQLSVIQVEYPSENTLRKLREETLTVDCGLEFNFTGRFYTLSKKPLQKIYRGETFLLRVNIEIASDQNDLDILDTYFICDHNLVQSNYSYKRKKYSNTYHKGEKIEDVIILRTEVTHDDWITAKEFEKNKSNVQISPSWHKLDNKNTTPLALSNGTDQISNAKNQQDGQPSLLSNNTGNENEKLGSKVNINTNTYCIYNKAIEALLPTGHHRGFLRSIITADLLQQQYQYQQMQMLQDQNPKQDNTQQQPLSSQQLSQFNQSPLPLHRSTHQQQQQQKPPQQTTNLQDSVISLLPQYPYFGVYCIKWRRQGSTDEAESKFVINGLDVIDPPLNIYCTIEEKMFVKMPMTFKIVLRNPTSKVLHLIATLGISNVDNFICSGHKQLDVSIFAYSERELVYNLYPLFVGWQNLPELTLEYNTQVDQSKDENQNKLLSELVERSMPKKVFVLPPLKQQPSK